MLMLATEVRDNATNSANDKTAVKQRSPEHSASQSRVHTSSWRRRSSKAPAESFKSKANK